MNQLADQSVCVSLKTLMFQECYKEVGEQNFYLLLLNQTCKHRSDLLW